MSMSAQHIFPKYDRQIILVLTNPNVNTEGANYRHYAEHLRQKADFKYKYPEQTVIVPLILIGFNEYYIPNETADALRNINNRTRLYIQGHSSQGGSTLSAVNTMTLDITAETLAEILKAHINPALNVLLPRNSQKLCISLVACYAGLPSSNATFPEYINDSFAAKFSYYLNCNNIDCTIAARLASLTINSHSGIPRINIIDPAKNEDHERAVIDDHEIYEKMCKASDELIKTAEDQRTPEHYKKLSALIAGIEQHMVQPKTFLIPYYYAPRDAHAKIIYDYSDGAQRITTAYASKPGESKQWYADVLDTINDCIMHTSSLKIKTGLKKLLNTILLIPSDRSVCHKIRQELMNFQSQADFCVNTHTDLASWLWQKKTYAHQQLTALLYRYPPIEI